MRDNNFDSVKYLIIEWAEVHSKPVNGLSYSGESIESRLMSHGCATGGAALKCIPSYSPNKRIKATDIAIQGLTRHYKDMLKYKYIEQRPEAELFVLANLGRTKYYQEMNTIYVHVAAWLHMDMR